MLYPRMELRKQNVVLLATIALVATLQLAAARQLLVPVNDEYYSYMGLTLDSAMTVKNVENRAVGTFKITNPTKEPFKIAWITYDFGFQMSYPFPKAADGIAHLQKSDWQQTLQLNTCGSIKLPTTIAPGASITCPFSSRMNLYGGPMSVVARVFDGSATPEDVDKLQKIVAYDVLKSGLDAYNPKIRGGPEGNPTVNKTYTAHKDKAIPVHDIECETGQQFCKICGGRAAVEAKCNSIPICVAFDMEDDKCGYVKQANGPMTAKTGFTSWVAA